VRETTCCGLASTHLLLCRATCAAYTSVSHLNDEQRQVVRDVLEGRAACADASGAPRGPPYCVLGPPGTGKTVTVVAAAMAVLATQPGARVLLCAPAAFAADVICSRLAAFASTPEAAAAGIAHLTREPAADRGDDGTSWPTLGQKGGGAASAAAMTGYTAGYARGKQSAVVSGLLFPDDIPGSSGDGDDDWLPLRSASAGYNTSAGGRAAAGADRKGNQSSSPSPEDPGMSSGNSSPDTTADCLPLAYLCSKSESTSGCRAWTMVRVNDPRRDPASIKADVLPFCAPAGSTTASSARVVVASCSSAGLVADAALSLTTCHRLAADLAGFTHIFVDEAGQATVPETLIPMRLVSARTQVLLAGDPRQLGPVVHSAVAAAGGGVHYGRAGSGGGGVGGGGGGGLHHGERMSGGGSGMGDHTVSKNVAVSTGEGPCPGTAVPGLMTSMLEMAAEAHQSAEWGSLLESMFSGTGDGAGGHGGSAQRRRCTRLVRNYRSHADIITLSSRLFYNNSLVACASELSTSLPSSLVDDEGEGEGEGGGRGGGRVARVLFYGVRGRQTREGRGEAPSYFNPVEAQCLVELLAGWLARGGKSFIRNPKS
jgi:hypothetical protein